MAENSKIEFPLALASERIDEKGYNQSKITASNKRGGKKYLKNSGKET